MSRPYTVAASCGCKSSTSSALVRGAAASMPCNTKAITPDCSGWPPPANGTCSAPPAALAFALACAAAAPVAGDACVASHGTGARKVSASPRGPQAASRELSNHVVERLLARHPGATVTVRELAGVAGVGAALQTAPALALVLTLGGVLFLTARYLLRFAVAPAVSAVSHQTPAFGSLPGSQGGEFVFQVPDSQEFLNADTSQLSADANIHHHYVGIGGCIFSFADK